MKQLNRYAPRKIRWALGSFWLVASIAVFYRGVGMANSTEIELGILIFCTVTIFSVMYPLIFVRMVQHNRHRINSMEEARIIDLLDKKGYLLMAVMMSLGIIAQGLQSLHLYLSPLYFGIAIALFISSIRLLKR